MNGSMDRNKIMNRWKLGKSIIDISRSRSGSRLINDEWKSRQRVL